MAFTGHWTGCTFSYDKAHLCPAGQPNGPLNMWDGCRYSYAHFAAPCPLAYTNPGAGMGDALFMLPYATSAVKRGHLCMAYYADAFGTLDIQDYSVYFSTGADDLPPTDPAAWPLKVRQAAPPTANIAIPDRAATRCDPLPIGTQHVYLLMERTSAGTAARIFDVAVYIGVC